MCTINKALDKRERGGEGKSTKLQGRECEVSPSDLCALLPHLRSFNPLPSQFRPNGESEKLQVTKTEHHTCLNA